MNSHGKMIVYELLIAFVAILLLVVLRPMFVGQIAGAGTPYTITYQNASAPNENGTVTHSTVTQTVTPSSAMSVTQADTIYSIVIYLVALIALVVIVLTVAGKI